MKNCEKQKKYDVKCYIFSHDPQIVMLSYNQISLFLSAIDRKINQNMLKLI